MANIRAVVGVGVKSCDSEAIAIRGERLALTRTRVWGGGPRHEAFNVELLNIIEIDTENRIAGGVSFDLDDIDAAFEELDARYLAGEAAASADTWSVIAGVPARFNRRELFATTPDPVYIDHRPLVSIEGADLAASIRAVWDITSEASVYIEAVHQLSERGAVFTEALNMTSQEGFDAEVRMIMLFTVEGGLISRVEVFDEAHLDAALARFEDLHPPTQRLENAAIRTWARSVDAFNRRDMDDYLALMTPDGRLEDRRKGLRALHDGPARRKAIEELFELPPESWRLSMEPIAIRGSRLSLSRERCRDIEAADQPITVELLTVLEVDDDDRIRYTVSFDPDDIALAFEELDARYLAGEAAAYSHTWSVIAQIHGAFNRHELPPIDWIVVDHRRGTLLSSSNMTEAIRAFWDLTPAVNMQIEMVHRLNSFGAVVTHTLRGTSPEGFEAEWRMIYLVIVEDERIDRVEMFDETDLDAALARFEELSPSARRLENAASQMEQRCSTDFAGRDWDTLAELLSDDFYMDDRRRVVSVGIRRGRDAEIANMRAVADVGVTTITPTVIAIRGRRLVLSHYSIVDGWSGSTALCVSEINTENQIVARVVFDYDDIDAAGEELDARYLAGEAAAYGDTWSVIAGLPARFNRRELPATTPDPVYIDHRPLVSSEGVDLAAGIRAVWDITSTSHVYIEAVHSLGDRGAVITMFLKMTSHEDFDAELRMIQMFTVEGDLLSGVEVFDETDLDAALARFEELQPETRRLENTASRAEDRFFAYYKARDWAAIAEILTDGSFIDNRTPVTSSGFWEGRDDVMANVQALADAVMDSTSDVLAIRGDRLSLARHRFPNGDARYGDFVVEQLIIAEIDTDERIAAHIVIDPDDIDAAFAELDARYIAGEAAAHADAWSVIARGCAAFNRQEPAAITPDLVYIDHRRLVSIKGIDLHEAQRAVWDLTPDIRTFIEAVHRLTQLGGVVTQVVKGTSSEGFDAEWRLISICIVEGDRLNRYEVFDEDDVDAALARFEELQPQAPRLENAASRVLERLLAHHIARNWDAVTEILAADIINDDRRRVVNAGVLHGRDATLSSMQATAAFGLLAITPIVIATRGEHLSLTREHWSVGHQRSEVYSAEVLGIIEINADERVVARIPFDPEDIDSAFEELDARYLADEAAPYARTWSAMARACAAFNQGELPATTPDSVFVDHRPVLTVDGVDLPSYLRVMWDTTPNIRVEIVAVHRLSELGAVVTQLVSETSPEGFNAEWRGVLIYTFATDMVNRCEVFDEADLDAALARFDELQPQAPRLENAASRAHARLKACIVTRDWNAAAEMFAHDIAIDDRRRVVNSGVQYGRDAAIADMRGAIDLGLTNISLTVTATRGDRLELSRTCISGQDQHEAFRLEFFSVVEIDADERIVARVAFDLDDIDAAFAELDARYLAGEAAAHSRTWSAIASGYAALNRHALPAITPDWVMADRRPLVRSDVGDLAAFIDVTWELTPNASIYIAAIHRLSHLGAVLTHVVHGVSQEGFAAEWRQIAIQTVEGDLFNRCEIFDEADLDVALARF